MKHMKQMRKMLKTTLLTTLFLLLAVSLLSRFPAIGNSLSEKAANWWTDKNAQLDRSIYGNECISETKHSLPFLILASASAEEETPEYLTIRLNWAGDEDKTELRPSYNVRLYVTKNGGSSSAYYVSGSNNWEVTTTASLKGADGSDYQYALDYVGTYLWPTYVVTDTAFENGVLTVTLTHQETVDMDLQLTWVDDDDSNGLRPEAPAADDVTLSYRGGSWSVNPGSIEQNEDGSWTAHFKGVPTFYRASNGKLYRCDPSSYAYQANVDGIAPYYQTGTVNARYSREEGWHEQRCYLTAQNILQAITVEATFWMQSYLRSSYSSELNWKPSWTRAEELGIAVPDSVSMTVLSNGQPIERADGTVTYLREDSGVYPTMKKKWYLPKYDADGKAIDYGTISVGYSPNQQKGEIGGEYVQTVTQSGSSAITVNIYTRIPGIGVVEMPATWNDDGNSAGVRPQTLSATLLADGVPFGEAAVLKLDETGKVSTFPETWKYLQQRAADGHYIQYSIQFNDLPAYYETAVAESPVYSKENGYGDTLRVAKLNENMTFTLKKQTATATVYWEGDGIGSETELKNRPSAVNLKLEYTTDGGATWQSYWGTDTFAVTPSGNTNEWTYEWSELPAVNAMGNPVQYRVVPADSSSMYNTSVEKPAYDKDENGNVTHSTFAVHESYNDNWNYTIDLKWNREKPEEKYHIETVTLGDSALVAQYNLSISVQKHYKVGELQVRIPYELFDRRSGEGTGTVVNRFSLGPETNPSSTYSFTYRIDDKGTKDTSDDEVVFYNYKDLNASDNCVIQVEYSFLPQNVIDCSLGSLTANATGRYDGQTEEEHQQSGPITYRVDNGIELMEHSKTVLGAMYYWDTSTYGTQPDDFDPLKYNYVSYRVHARWRWNQPHTMYFTEKPGNGGEVCCVRTTSSNVNFTTDPDTLESVWTCSYSGGASRATYDYYVVVRYPRIPHEDPLKPGQTTYETDYQNAVEFNLHADDQHPGDNDQNDIAIATDATAMHWVDYKFVYDGELFSDNKTMYSFTNGALTAMKYGGYAEASCTVGMTVNGYNLKNGYSMEIKDDATYLCATINGKTTDYVRLTEEDYEFSGKPYINVTLTGIDQTNGKPVDGQVPADSFIFWGRKGNSGEWEEIGRFSLTKSSQGVRMDDLSGKGYTALRLTTPDDLQDKANIVINGFNLRIFGTSAQLAQWLNQEGLSSMTAQNVAAFNVYARDEQGRMYWVNPYSDSTNSFAKKWGLDAEDKAQFGAYQHRRNDSSNLYPAQERGYMQKYVDRPLEYDITTETMTAHFTLFEYESIDNTSLPQEVYDAKCQNGAVMYDLLPKGFVYAADRGTRVYGASNTIQGYGTGNGGVSYAPGQGAGEAALVSVKTIDDYHGTGRQMVIFTVKSTKPENANFYANYSTWYTGFSVQFYARAGYNDVTSGVKLYNICAVQRDDGKAIPGGYTERGYGAYNNESIFVLDENGQRALYDVNGDGIVSEETNTLYGYTDFTPSMIQTIQNGLAKIVKGESGIYQKDDIVVLEGHYSYKLRLTTQKNGETSNVVLYDILENAANTGGASGEPNGWKGTFVGVNTRVAQALGVAPVVLYSTEKLSYNNPDALLIENNPDVWSTTPPEDFSTVTAVAFDLRKAADGSNFIFPENSNVEVEITLQAPDGIQPSKYAYNRPAYNSTFKAAYAQEGSTSFNISDRTTLKLRDLQTISFIKEYVNDADERAPLANVQFKLYRCTNTEEGHKHNLPGTSNSCWGTAIATTASMTNGSVRFDDLDTGVYAVYETAVPDGFERLNNYYWVFEVDATKGTVSDPVVMGAANPVSMEKREDGTWTLLNERRSIYIEVNKTWKDDGSQIIRPKTLTFDLYRNDVLYRTQEVEAKSGSLGIVFRNLPIYDDYGNKFTYKVVERVPEGYVEVNNGEVSVSTNYNKAQYARFTNTRLGVLDIKKVVKGSDVTTAFGFTITLTDTDDNPLTGEISARRFTVDAENYTTETLTLDADGRTHILLASGETLRLIGLPEGAKWQVAEDENNYVTTVTPNPASGTVGSTVNPSVVFTNVPKAGVLALPIHKTVEGSTTQGAGIPFTFEIAAVTTEAPLPTPTTAMVTGAGTASFAPITFTHTGAYVYRVTETAGNAGGYQYDDTAYEVTVTVTDVDGQLTAAWTAKKGSETAEALTFTNTYSAAGSLRLTAAKQVNGNTPTDTQVFDFELASGEETPAVHQTKRNEGGNVTFDRIDYTQADAGKTYHYTVKETTADGSGFTMDKTVYTITVTITDNGDGTLAVVPTYSNGTGETTAMVFRNTYEATGSLSLTATKLVNGGTPNDLQVFDFELASGADTPNVHQTKQNAGSHVSFDRIDYTLADAGKTYTYTVKETTVGGNGMTVDTTIYTVTVAIEDNHDGTLSVVPTYSNGTCEATEMVFRNTYEASGSLTLTAYKTVNGNMPTNAQVFDFELASGADTPTVHQAKQNAGGTIVFDPLHYSLADVGKTYTYTVKETSTDGSGFTTDKTAYTVHVLVEDNHDGTLKLTVTADDGQKAATRLTFDNAYEATGKLSLKALKTVNSKEPAEDQRYTFELASGADTPAIKQIKENELGLVTFDDIAYTLADAGKTYQYTVRETTQDSGGLTVDKTVYTVTAAIVDNGDGTLTVTPAYSNGTETVQEIAFDNKLAGSIVLSKKVEGEVTDEEFAFGFTFTDEADTLLTEKFAYTGSRTGEVGSGDTLKLKDGESVVFDSVPVGTICTVTEESRARYTTTVNAESINSIRFSVTSESMPIAFVNTLVTTKFTVTKEWQGGDGGAITLTLYANGQKLDPQPAYTRDGDTYTYTGLPKYDSQGQTIVYSAKERYMDGYMTIYKNVSPYESESGFIYNGGTIINRAVTEIAVRKVWTGMDENEERPEITLTLYCNGQKINKKPKLDKNGWYHFYNLPLRETPYYVVETPVDGYATSYENYGSYADVTDRVYNGGTITNHKLPKTMDSQPLALYGFLLVVALAGVVFCWKKRQQD